MKPHLTLIHLVVELLVKKGNNFIETFRVRVEKTPQFWRVRRLQENSFVIFEKSVANAFLPTRKREFSAVIDLKSAYDYSISAHSSQVVDVGIKVHLPEGCCGNIASRFNLTVSHSVIALRGVVRSNEETIKVVLLNHSDETFYVKRGDNVAKLICQQTISPSVEETCDLPLDATDRGEAGFGSTGI